MLRRPRVVLAALLVVALGVGWLLPHPWDSPVLRTVTIGSGPGPAGLVEEAGRLDISNGGDNSLSTIDTGTGALLPQPGILVHAAGLPVVDYRSRHLFDTGSSSGVLLMLDARSGKLLRTIPVPWHLGIIAATFDAPTERIYLAFQESPVMITLDGRTGNTLGTTSACAAASWIALSRVTGHLFEPCIDGTTAMFDAHRLRLIRMLNTTALGGHNNTALCGGQGSVFVDDRTGRIFLPADKALGMLDARTGALVRSLPIQSWNDNATLDLDPRTGNVVVAPYVAPLLGAPAAAVLLLDGRSGAVLRRWPVPVNPTAVAVNRVTGHLLVASTGPVDVSGVPLGHGTLSVLDMDRGTTLQRIETGTLPGEIYADNRTGHGFVLNFTTDLTGHPLTASYPEGWWPQALRRVKSLVGWLPFTAPAAPKPSINATMMMLDLRKL